MHRVNEAFATAYADRFKEAFELDGSKVPASVRQFDAACKALFTDQEKVSGNVHGLSAVSYTTRALA
jgi:hypothetical protein